MSRYRVGANAHRSPNGIAIDRKGDRVFVTGLSIRDTVATWEGGHGRLRRGHRHATCLYNGLLASPFGQAGAVVALREPQEHFDVQVKELGRRADVMMRQLEGLPAVRPEGGWSLLLNTEGIGLSPQHASDRLLEQKVAATP